MVINFVSSKKDSDKKCILHAKSDNIEVMMGSETNEIIEEILLRKYTKYLLRKYQQGLEKSVDGSNLIFDSVDALYYSLNKTSLSSGGSYIDSPE